MSQIAKRTSKEDRGATHPCLLVGRKSTTGKERRNLYARAQMLECDSALGDGPVNRLEVDLRNGLFVLRETDLFLPDVLPIVFTRTYRPWDRYVRALGIGTNHPYDVWPVGSKNPYTYIDLILADGNRVHFERASKGRGFADAAYEPRDAPAQFRNSRISWNGNGWTLRLQDGMVYLFPEAAEARTPVQGALVGIADVKGNRILIGRDEKQNLIGLKSTGGRWVRFIQDSSNRIREAKDDQGHTVRYAYDPEGRLIEVTDVNGVQTRFSYEQERMVAILGPEGRAILRNRYEQGRISQMILADGRRYRFRYTLDRNGSVRQTEVLDPLGLVTNISFENGRWVTATKRRARKRQ